MTGMSLSLRPLYVLSALDVWDVSSQLEVNVILDTVFDALRLAADAGEMSKEDVVMPHRTSIESRQHTTLFMPSKVKDCVIVKVVSIPRSRGGNGGGEGIPATTLVVDDGSGVADVVVNARSLTALRTAAASTIATKLSLKPSASPTRLVLFGAGAQNHAHARLLVASFPSLKHITVINRSHKRLHTLLEQFRAEFDSHTEVVGLSDSEGSEQIGRESAVREADIIVTATSSTVPLFPSAWVKPGAHVNLIGSFTPSMREVEEDLIRRARIVLVDSRAACAREAGELISAKLDFDTACVELGECAWNDPVSNSLEHVGSDGGDVTIYKSVGVSVMDAAITRLVVKTARERGKGVYIPFD